MQKLKLDCVHAHEKYAHAHAIKDNLINFRTVGIDFSNSLRFVDENRNVIKRITEHASCYATAKLAKLAG